MRNATAAISLIIVFLLGSGCAINPKGGQKFDEGAQIPLTATVPVLLNPASVVWSSAHVANDGSILLWEPLFSVPAAGALPITDPVTGIELLLFSGTANVFNWTQAKTGYTGGCGNLPQSCPKHALIKAEVSNANGIAGLVTFPKDSEECIIDTFTTSGSRAVVEECSTGKSDGIVAIFANE